jgi:hypothetical protein
MVDREFARDPRDVRIRIYRDAVAANGRDLPANAATLEPAGPPVALLSQRDGSDCIWAPAPGLGHTGGISTRGKKHPIIASRFTRHFRGMPRSVRVRPTRSALAFVEPVGSQDVSRGDGLENRRLASFSLCFLRDDTKEPSVCAQECAQASGHDNEVTPSCCQH